MARSINSSYSTLSFTYLWISVGKDMRKTEAWDEVVNRFSKRLSMLKAVLKVYVYFFSIFKAPEVVISRFESVRQHFL